MRLGSEVCIHFFEISFKVMCKHLYSSLSEGPLRGYCTREKSVLITPRIVLGGGNTAIRCNIRKHTYPVI